MITMNTYHVFKTLLSAAVMLAVSSCVKNAEGPAVEGPSRERIGFNLAGSSVISSGVSTKADVVTASTLEATGFNVSATAGAAGEESELFTGVAFSKSGTSFKGEAYWPKTEPAGGIHFYASNAAMSYSSGSVKVSAANTTDVVCAYLASPTFKAENTLTFEHVFARLGTVTVNAKEGYTLSDVSVTVTPKTGGTYDIHSGYGSTDGTGWSDTVTGSETVVANAAGANATDILLVPGHYVFTVSWTSTKGGISETFTGETVEFDLEAGVKSLMELTLGGSLKDMTFAFVVTPWNETTITPAGGQQVSRHLTFEVFSDGVVSWKCNNATYQTTIYYRKNGGEWTTITSTTSGADIPVVENDILEFYGENNTYANTSSNYYNYFASTAKYYAYGDVSSLYNWGSTVPCIKDLFRLNTNLYSHSEKRLVLPSKNLTNSCYTEMFIGCTNMTVAPELPATRMESRCYESMFYACSNLTAAPELNATTLADNCYRNMFTSCTSLTVPPDLPATTLANYCYQAMFNNCSNLTTAPELPATTLTDYCYEQMFLKCTKLIAAPELPATSLALGCYQEMFSGCSSLIIAPELPAITMTNNCYYQMFSGCSSLTTAPELPATSLASSCYHSMFWNCSKLVAVPSVLPATTLASACYFQMFTNCKELTVTPELPATTLAFRCYGSMFQGCSNLTTAPQLPAMTLADNCYDNMFSSCNLTTAPELPATTLASSCYNSMFWGNKNMIITPELPATTLANSCYQSMFQGCSSLTTAPELPATTLAQYCYQSMFANCTSLTAAPELRATTLADYCYQSMFQGCSSLTTAPELPATTLAANCYQNMFYSCSSLTTAPELPATTLAANCYYQMFYSCSKLSTAPELPATTLAENCYSSMFNRCSSLTTAPELPATTLASACYSHMFNSCRTLSVAPVLPATNLVATCYYYMFYGCNSLNNVTCYATNISAGNCLTNWLNNTSSTGTFTKHPDMDSWPRSTSGIPSGWTVVDASL